MVLRFSGMVAVRTASLLAAICLNLGCDAAVLRRSGGSVVGLRGTGGLDLDLVKDLERTSLDLVTESSGALDQQYWTQIGNLVQRSILNDKEGLKIHDIVRKISNKMGLRDALPRLAGKLPVQLMEMAYSAAGSRSNRSRYVFTESSLAKALAYFNEMLYDAWGELDAVTISCKEFTESNRGTWSQVTTDLEHIASELADSERAKTAAINGMDDMTAKIKETNSFRTQVEREYQTTRLANQHELQLRTADKEVFDMVLELTRCQAKDSDEYSVSFAQKNAAAPTETLPLEICDTDNGTVVQSLNNALGAKLEHSPQAEQALISALEAARLGEGDGDGDDPTVLLETGKQAPPPVEVRKEPKNKKNQFRMCRKPEKVNCGLIHDMMAQQWGKLKDLVDELTVEMEHNDDEFHKQLTLLNEQVTIYRQEKLNRQTFFAEATSQIQSLRTEKGEKDTQSRDLESAYQKRTHQCKTRIQEILYTNICAVRVVRDSVMSYSEVSPPSKMSDCDFTDWSAGPCSVDCDDTCPTKIGATSDPYKCGGFQTLNRELVDPANQYGMTCPALEMKKKCNQFRCPINCQVSEWSGFSKCTAECGGGNQQRTRSLLVRPRNGGSECDSSVESRACNTDSCDRNCVLDQWTHWSGCSAACGGGVQRRVRNVIVPIRAMGKCPAKTHADRLEEKECNTQLCKGDEVCIARQDLVIAIDASGSMRRKGFQEIRDFAANLTSRYKSFYYGKDRMKVGVLMFGQGRYIDASPGYISAAEQVQPMTFNLAAVSKSIRGLEWQRGLTNVMQALKLADKMLEKGRPDAQSAILVITDGKYTNAFRTSQKIQQLKDKNVQIYMAPITAFENDNIKVLKTWASQPWDQNYERIPGLSALKNNYGPYAQRLVAKFCPESLSPSLQNATDRLNGYTLVRQGFFPSASCSTYSEMPLRFSSPGECFNEIRSLNSGVYAFTFMTGSEQVQGKCYTETIQVTSDMWKEYVENATDVPCPGGNWEDNPYANTYFMNPDLDVSLG